MTPINALIKLSTTPEKIDQALTEVGGYASYEVKVAYLEGLTQSKIVHRSGGGSEDDFWALAEAIVNGDIEIST